MADQETLKSKITANTTVDGLCYFLVCFKSTEFVSFLLASIYRESDTFIIHCDKKAPDDLKDYINEISERHENIIAIDSQDYSWAGYSHVKVSLDAVAISLNIAQDRPWSHLIFLSEQHLPLKSPDRIAAYLRDRKSIVAVRSADSMTGRERADIENRFYGRYRELPGVGCFVIGLKPRSDNFFETIYHGSNWMILHQEHCRVLDNSRGMGRFEAFVEIVHAEETAIQSVLSAQLSEFENRDAVLVAAPNLTDNHNLVMSEELFRKNINTEYLFIRKRTQILSNFVISHIKNNHFFEALYKPDSKHPDKISEYTDLYRKMVYDFCAGVLKKFRIEPSIQLIDQKIFDYIPSFYVVINHPEMRKNLSVRVVSENLHDFKIILMNEKLYDGVFEKQYVDDQFLYSTIRSRIFGLFGYQEILPLNEVDGGFISIPDFKAIEQVAAIASRFLQSGIVLSNSHKSVLSVDGDTN